jgi:hypothetical protein
MFTRAFVTNVLVPAQQGQTGAISSLMHEVARLVAAHPALANGGFAAVQIALGLGLLSRRAPRVLLGGSIAWALLVWSVGEGFGGLTMGASLLSGAPGAALLYAVIATLAWPTRDAEANDRPSRLAVPAWSAYWLGGAVLQVVNENNSMASLPTLLRNAHASAPGWIGAIDHQVLRLQLPTWFAAIFVALYVLVAIWVLVPGRVRQLSVGVGTVVALVSWLVFQGLGNLTSGTSTDPNTGPLVLVLALAVLGATRSVAVEVPTENSANETLRATTLSVARREPVLV